MSLRRETEVVRVAEATSRPWRNGAGRTVSLHSHAPSVRAEPSWTLTMASLERAVDFSAFPGYDRHLMISDRMPVVLDVDGRRCRIAYTEVVRFSGEAHVRVSLDHGPSSALNLMVRRSDCWGDLTLCRIHGDRIVDPGQVTALVLLSGTLDVSGTALHVRGDTVVVGKESIIVRGDSAVVAQIRVEREQHGHLQRHTDRAWPDERIRL